jgi:hypothetical protein
MHHTYCNIVQHLNIDSALFTLQWYIQFFFAKGSYFNLNAEPAKPSLALHHICMDLPPTRMNSSRQHLISLPAVLLPSKSCFHHGKREVPWL